MSWRIEVPGSSANLGPGFDVLGLALEYYLRIDVEPSRQWSIQSTGIDASQLPADETNLIIRAAKLTFQQIGAPVQPLSFQVKNGIPIGMGLGSSAAAIIAGGLAAMVSLETGVDPVDDGSTPLAAVSYELEGHIDNAMASLLGGFTVAVSTGSRFHVRPLPFATNWHPVLLLPEERLLTPASRKLLPKQIPFESAVSQVGRTALLIEALAHGEKETALAGCHDLFHQPYRRDRYPMIDQLLSTASLCQLPFWLSGSGPAVVVLFDDDQRSGLDQLRRNIAETMPGCEVAPCGVDRRGAQIID